MAETGQEVVIVSTLNDDQCAFSLWNLRTANLIKSYKPNQQQGCHCLVKAGQDYVLTSQQNKQVINVWEWKKVFAFVLSLSVLSEEIFRHETNYVDVLKHLVKVAFSEMPAAATLGEIRRLKVPF